MSVYALTIWQPWASLVIEGAKPFEFRGHALPRHIRGKRVVIHAAKRPARTAEIQDAIKRIERGHLDGMIAAKALDILDRAWRREPDLPHACALGTAVIAGSTPCNLLFPDDRAASPERHGWQMMLVRKWREPVPRSGLQGFWLWPTPLEADQ